jgi:hypothetical protein
LDYHLTILDTSFGQKLIFQGPWGGFDFFINPIECFRFSFGYELHHAHFRDHFFAINATSNLSGTNVGTAPFTGTYTHHRVWGHIGHAELYYLFWHCWTLGVDLRFQVWQAQRTGDISTTTPFPAGAPFILRDVAWKSFSSFLTLGFAF